MRVDCFAGVPVDSSGRFAGCERMPAALRAAGLASALPGAEDLGNFQVSLADPVRDPATGIIGYRDLVAATEVIRRETASLLRAGMRPLLSGGCCSALIGIAAAVRDVHPGAGLAFIDGHYDCYTGQTSPTGEAADMELAILLGDGPAELVGLTGAAPVCNPDRVVVLGPRDGAQAAADGAPDPASLAGGVTIADHDQITVRGAAAVGRLARDVLSGVPGAGQSAGDTGQPASGAGQAFARPAPGTGQFWVHVDLDVLSTEAFPAADYLQDGGLDWPALGDLVRPLTAAPGFLGIDVTILNPLLDPDGTTAAATASWLSETLA